MQAVQELWLDLRLLHEPLVDLFNEYARPNDIARVEHVEDLPLLDQITAGRKLVVFRSAAEAEAMIPRIADRIDIVGYNLEDRAASPRNERADPVQSAQRMRTLADEYKLQLAFGPDHGFALSHGAAIAPYVDIFVLQIQLAQTNPQQVYDFVLPLIPKLRQANPNLEISVQIRSEGPAQNLVDLVDSLRHVEGGSRSSCYLLLDGVSILSRRDTVPAADRLIAEIRNRKLARLSRCTPAEATTQAAEIVKRAAEANQANSGSSPVFTNSTLVGTICALVTAFFGGGIYLLKCRRADQQPPPNH